MINKIIVDTNLWIYLYANNPLPKYLRIQQIILADFSSIFLTNQILGELYHVLTRKKFKSKSEAKAIVIQMMTSFAVLDIDSVVLLKALDINEMYNYSYWDSLLIATALLNDCSILYSEDMQHNQLIENKTRIINPFLE